MDRRPELAARAAIDAEREFNEAIVGAAGVLFCVLDEEARFVRFNRECERITGWREEEIRGRTPWDTVLPPEAVAAVRAGGWQPLFTEAQGGSGYFVNEWMHRNGARRCIEWSNRLVRRPDGQRFVVAIGIDVTEREAARRRLERSEAQLRKAQRVAQIGSWHLDLVCGRLEWSDEVFRIFEIDPQQFGASYEAFLGLVHPEDRALVDTAYRTSLETRQPYRVVHRLLMPDGRIKWVEEQCDSEFDLDGKPLRSDGTVQDVTEQYRAAQAIQRSEAALRALLDGYPGWVAAIDEEERYVYVNEAFSCQVGLPAADIVGKTLTDIRGAHVAVELREIMQRLRAGAVVQTERCYPDADGRLRHYWVHYRMAPAPGAADRQLFYAFAVDVTDYRLNELRLSTIAEATGFGTWQWDARSGLLEVDDNALALAGYRRAQVPGDLLPWILSLIHPQDREARRCQYERILSGASDCIDVEYRVRHRGGHWVWLLDRGRVATRDVDGRAVLVVGATQEITPLKLQQERLAALAAELEDRVAQRTLALKHAKEDAERANAAKTDFLSRVSHELRTPLNAILGFAQLLELASLDPQEKEHVGEILRAGHHLLDLINEMLDLATIEAGHIQLTYEAIALKDLIDECLRLMTPTAERAGLRLENAISDTCDRVWADRKRLRQVLLNLISNAIKYNRRGGRVTVACSCDEGMCEVRVADTGTGMTSDQVAKLFQPFERLGAERLGVPGTGIGLTVSKRLVELMRGDIGVDSLPGVGSTFFLRLPTAAFLQTAADTVGAVGEYRYKPGQATVLYVEDNPANRLLVQRALAHYQHVRLLLAEDAEQAVPLALNERPDVLLIDIQLPGIDGYELLARLRAAGCMAPAVAVSANAMPADLARGREAGFLKYLTKPLDLGRLLRTLADLTDNRDRHA
ncbi:MAG: PAS domain S-box protein [Burkholderiaceae bacterium]|nr:PAS domain S-box protein [Burkholderiaceae bacterium]